MSLISMICLVWHYRTLLDAHWIDTMCIPTFNFSSMFSINDVVRHSYNNFNSGQVSKMNTEMVLRLVPKTQQGFQI